MREASVWLHTTGTGVNRSRQAASVNKKVTLVAHSRVGELARQIGRDGTTRFAGTGLHWRKGEGSKNV